MGAYKALPFPHKNKCRQKFSHRKFSNPIQHYMD